MTGLALALAAGAALPPAGVPFLPAALLLLAASIRPIPPVSRPAGRRAARPRSPFPIRIEFRWFLLAGLAGLGHGRVATDAALRDCRWRRPAGDVEVRGWVREVEAPGRVRLRVVDGPCPGELRVQGVVPGDVAEGVGLRIGGRWISRGAGVVGQDPVRAGVLLVRSAVADPDAARGWAAGLARLRAAGVSRVEARFRRESPLVAALLFARRDGLDPGLREDFTATGTAHLLAISGFHVGVFAGVVIWLVGRWTSRRRAFGAGTAAAWFYVAVLGFPDAATRAAVLLSLVTLGRLVGRPVSAAGALGTALLALVAVDPGLPARVGAQLSFAGALGLALLARPWTEATVRAWERRSGRPTGDRSRGLLEAGAVTVAATLATLPFVAWHFERVSLVAVPASLGATPLVALALPSILVALVLDLAHLPGATVAAAGAEGLLGLARVWVSAWAGVPWASLPVARPEALAAAAGVGVGWAIVRIHLRVGPAVRAVVVATALVSGLVAWPVSRQLLRNGSLEVHMFDVGQGDALGIRTPGGRWVVVDAGPPSGARLARDLRRVGARSLDLLLLSHPDADHVGGAATLLSELRVETVAGPGTVRGAGPWRDAVEAARASGTPWRVLGRGDAFALDGVAFRLLHPGPAEEGVPRDPNAASLILEVAWHGVSLLFTGDAPVEAERAVVRDLGPQDVLKVGHHGSSTSTDSLLLARIRPSVALVSVGRGNRYGHPEPEVLQRLRDAGAEVWRTDERGHVVVRVTARGEVTVTEAR